MRHAAFVFLVLVLPSISWAEECCDCRCDNCGCQAHCEKVCRVVCEMKDVKVTCYCCKEEDICIPGHSKKCGEVCEPNPCCLAHPKECDACSEAQCGENGCGSCHKRSFLDCLLGHDCCEKRTVWQPSCSGDARSVNKLIKYEVSKKVPTYKWIVEYRCDKCRCDMHEGEQPPAPPPSVPQSSSKTAAATTPPVAQVAAVPAELPPPPAAARPVGQRAMDQRPAATTAQSDLPWYRLDH